MHTSKALSDAISAALKDFLEQQRTDLIYGVQAGLPPLAPWPTLACNLIFLDLDGVLNSNKSGLQVGTKYRFSAHSVAALAARYLEHLGVRNYNPQTILSLVKQLRYFRQYCEKRGVTRVDQITRQCILDYQAHLFQQYRKQDGGKLAVSTQNQWLMAVKGFMAWITRQGVIPFNPASDMGMPRKEYRLPRAVLSSGEVNGGLTLAPGCGWKWRQPSRGIRTFVRTSSIGVTIVQPTRVASDYSPGYSNGSGLTPAPSGLDEFHPRRLREFAAT